MPLWTGWRRQRLARASWEQSKDLKPESHVCPATSLGRQMVHTGHGGGEPLPLPLLPPACILSRGLGPLVCPSQTNKKPGVQPRGDELEPARLLPVCWPPSPITNLSEQWPLLLLPFPKPHTRDGILREKDGREQISPGFKQADTVCPAERPGAPALDLPSGPACSPVCLPARAPVCPLIPVSEAQPVVEERVFVASHPAFLGRWHWNGFFSNFLICPVAGTSDSRTVCDARPRASQGQCCAHTFLMAQAHG